MAATKNRMNQTAAAAAKIAGKLRAVHSELAAFLKYNSAQEINWNEISGERLDADGNLDGFDFPPSAVANAIGTFESHRKLLNNEQVTDVKGDHIGNLNKLASPLD